LAAAGGLVTIEVWKSPDAMRRAVKKEALLVFEAAGMRYARRYAKTKPVKAYVVDPQRFYNAGGRVVGSGRGRFQVNEVVWTFRGNIGRRSGLSTRPRRR